MSQSQSQGRKRTRATSSLSQPSQSQSQNGGTQASSSGPSSTAPSSYVPPDYAEYGDFHKAILNVFMSRSCLSSMEIRDLFRTTCSGFGRVFPGDTSEYYDMVAAAVGAINLRMKNYRMIIKKISSGTTLDSFYCLANQSTHEVHKEQNVFTVTELEYLYEVINKILDSPERSITGHRALNVKLPTKQINTSTADELLQKFGELKFFVMYNAKTEQVTLGPRALVELEPYIRDRKAEAVQPCVFCQGMIIAHGVICNRCDKRCHPVCLIRSIDPVNADGNVVNCADCREPFPQEIVDKYRKMARRKCREVEEAEQMEIDRQERANNLVAG